MIQYLLQFSFKIVDLFDLIRMELIQVLRQSEFIAIVLYLYADPPAAGGLSGRPDIAAAATLNTRQNVPRHRYIVIVMLLCIDVRLPG